MCTILSPRLTLVSDGYPLRRLLEGSKAVHPFVVVFVSHDRNLLLENNPLTMCSHSRRAMLLKSLAQFRGNLFRSSAFDLVPLHHVHKLAVLQKPD
jgi:hypothetical protein